MRISDWSSDVCSSDLWRDKHLFLINTTHSLPNWAFLIDRGRMPAKGEFIFFDPPASPLMQRHFGPKPRMFGKKVYGVGGDVVGHDGFEVLINGVPTVRMKPFTKAEEPLTPGATGVDRKRVGEHTSELQSLLR